MPSQRRRGYERDKNTISPPQNIIDDDNDYKVAGHTSPTAEETVFFEPFVDLDLALGEEGRLVQAEAKAAIQMVSYC